MYTKMDKSAAQGSFIRQFSFRSNHWKFYFHPTQYLMFAVSLEPDSISPDWLAWTEIR